MNCKCSLKNYFAGRSRSQYQIGVNVSYICMKTLILWETKISICLGAVKIFVTEPDFQSKSGDGTELMESCGFTICQYDSAGFS